MRNYLVLTTVIIILLFSCDNENQLKEIKKYHASGQLSLKGYYIGDSTNYEGNLITYFEDGTIANEYVFKNGLQDGIQKYYYATGVLEGVREYKNGIVEGIVEDYFINGSKKSTGFSLNEKLYGKVNYYYENGKIKSYGCVDKLEKTFYLIKWNEEGIKIKETGNVFSTNYEFLKTENKTTTTDIMLKVAVAEPPNRKTIVLMGELDKPLKEVGIKDYSVSYKTKIGKKIIIKGIIKDLNDSILMEDADTITVNM